MFTIFSFGVNGNTIAPAMMVPATVTPATATNVNEDLPITSKPEDIQVNEKPSSAINEELKKQKVVPMIPLESANKTGGVLEVTKKDGDGKDKIFTNSAWKLEQNISVYVDEKVQIFVPLEIESDINVGITVVNDEVVKAKFDIKFKSYPTSLNNKYYYLLKYVDASNPQTNINGVNREDVIKNATNSLVLDMDRDGREDTVVYSESPYIDSNIKRDNYIEVDGAKISNSNVNKVFNRQIYMIVDANL